MSKYESVDWKRLQTVYDNGGCYRDLNKMGHTNACLNWGIKNGKLTMRKRSEASRLAWTVGRQNPEKYKTELFRRKCAKNGGTKPNSGRCKSICYVSPIAGKVFLQGTWEHKYAMWLDENKINWSKDITPFPYEFNGRKCKYFPDFHLVDENRYVEIKGYETDRDRAKWSQFPEKLLVLKRKDLVSNPYNFKL